MGKADHGSFTIEASMLMPIIMFITMLLLFFSLYNYQKAMLLQIASASSERASFNWDNSYKEKTGAFAAGEYDSLYWRIGEDGLLSSLFGDGGESGGTKIELPGAGDEEGTLPVLKMSRASQMIPANVPGMMQYEHHLTGRNINLELKRMLKLPVLDTILLDQARPIAGAQSIVVEPVEFIRTIDMMRYYGAKFKGRQSGGDSGSAMKQEDASAMLKKLQKK